MSSQDAQEIEVNITELQKAIAVADALERLHSNKDFKEIIVKGYLTDEAVRLVHLKGAAAMQRPEAQKDILTAIDGISALMNYFRKLYHQAEIAEKSIEANRAELAELEAEEGEVTA